jgi:hypothetical protein
MKATLTKSGSIKLEMGKYDWDFIEMAIRDYIYENKQNPVTRLVARLYNPYKMIVERPKSWTLNITNACLVYAVIRDPKTMQYLQECENQRDRMELALGRYQHLLIHNNG